MKTPIRTLTTVALSACAAFAVAGCGNKLTSWTEAPDAAREFSLKVAPDKTITFSATLKDRFKEGSLSSESFKLYEFERKDGEQFPTPTVQISVTSHGDVDKLAESFKGDTILKKEKSATGYVLHVEGKPAIQVITMRKVGDVQIGCTAKMLTILGGEKVRAEKATHLPLLEKTCESIHAK